MLMNGKSCLIPIIVSVEESSWSDVLSDIPQGSALRPALFLVYINDLPDSITKFVKIFADDMKVYSTISTSDNGSIMVQNDLTALSDWSDIWELRFNARNVNLST